MAKIKLRKKAIELRLQGYTYGQIKRELGLPKSTLSDWLRNLSLTIKQIELLSKNKTISKDLRIERFRSTMRDKRISKLGKIITEQEKSLLPLSKKELFIAGLFLYLGEGNKQRNIVAISNTNPIVIQFAKYWMTKILKVPANKLKVRLHLYSDMDINEKIDYWSNLLSIPKEQFSSPYIKKSKRDNLTYKSYGHGTCNLMCFNTNLSEKIAMSIKLITERCGAKNDLFWYN